MKRIVYLLIYDLRTYFRHKDTLFWTLAWPLFWLILTAYVFIPQTPSSITVNVALISLDEGLKNFTSPMSHFMNVTLPNKTFTNMLITNLKSVNGTKGVIYKLRMYRNICISTSKCLVRARDMLIHKDYDVALVIPRNATKCYSSWFPVRIYVLVKASRPEEEYLRYGYVMNVMGKFMFNLTKVRIEDAVRFVTSYWMKWYRQYNVSTYTELNETVMKNVSKYIKYFFLTMASPIWPNISVVKPKTITDRPGIIGWTIIGAIGLSIVIASMVSAAGFFAFRKEDGVLRTLLASPIKLSSILIEDIISTLIISAVSAGIIIAVGIAIGGRIIFNAMNPTHYVAIVMLLIAALSSYAIGLLMAPTIKTSRAVTAAVALGLFFVFLTGIWWPPKWMLPLPLRLFADVFPTACAFEAMRDLIVWNKPLIETSWNIIKALIGTGILYVMNLAMYRNRLERIAEKVIYS